MTDTANIASTKVVPVLSKYTPYYDDYDESKNFYRLIFRPGYAVQGRELTQLQTILQAQIERFGNHIFKNGSPVLGGAIRLDTSGSHLNLATTYANTQITAASFKANTINYGSGNVKVRAYTFDTAEATSSEPPTLFVKYFSGDEFSNVDTIAVSSGQYKANVVSTGPTTLASIADGIFFVNGYFVKIPSQTIVIDKYSDVSSNVKVGLEYSEDIIDETVDTSLLDPAQESSNYQAPGAARLKINFNLVTRPLDTEDEATFIQLMRVENGVVKYQVNKAQYSDIGDELARRTFDESGDYTVRRFPIHVNTNTDDTKLTLALDPGKAYVKGYEVETIAPTYVDLNKARTTQYANNRTFTVSVGNYLMLQNLQNSLDTSIMETVDLHSVMANAISTANANAYASTKVATSRAKQLRYYSSTDINDANTDIFQLAIMDTRLANIKTNAISATANTVSLFNSTGLISPINHAYLGSTVRVLSGPGAGEKYNIVNYDGANNKITIAQNWISQPNASSQISLDLDMDSVASVARVPNFTVGASTGLTVTGNVNIMSVESANGYTRLYDTNKKPLIFWAGDSYIAPSTPTNQTFTYWKYIANPTAFTTGGVSTISLSAGETFWSSNDSTGIAYSTLAGISAFRQNNGKRIKLSSLAIDGTGTAATLTVPAEGAQIPYTVYAKVNINSGAESKPKGKVLRFANTSHVIASGTNLTQNTSAGVTSSYVNITGNVTGQAIITSPSNLPNESMSLFVVDVKEITAIYDVGTGSNAAPTSGTTLSTYTNVTNDFNFDNGQRDDHYTYASVSLKASATAKKGPLIVCFKWYEHTNGSSDGLGYFNVDSYGLPETYAGIPNYIASDGSIYPLRDSIDFRPTRTNLSATTPNFSLSDVRIPADSTIFQEDYQYYLPRKAYLALTTDPYNPFRVIDGAPARIPLEPALPSDAMVLYKLTLAPYTAYPENVSVQYVENKRYTMRDIGKLETRIERLEYYQTLSTLEKKADSMKILDANGLERTKYGIIADDFTTQTYGATNDNDYFVAIDTAAGGLYPAETTTVLDLHLTSNTNAKIVGDVGLLNYTDVVEISQNVATKWELVQPYMTAVAVGTMITNPADDNWVSTNWAPDLVINTQDGKNLAFLQPNSQSITQPYITKRNFADRFYGLPLWPLPFQLPVT